MTWDIISNAANLETLTVAVISAVSTHVLHNLPTPESELEWCRKELDGIKTRLNELSPDRRERLCMAAARKQCTSLEALENQLQRLLDERCELVQRAKQADFWERNLPATLKLSRLRTDIREFKTAIESLQSDTNNTTTFHLREDKARARDRSMTADANTHARPQPSTLANTNGMHVSGQPEDHPLDIMPPPPAHTTGRYINTEVPIGIA